MKEQMLVCLRKEKFLEILWPVTATTKFINYICCSSLIITYQERLREMAPRSLSNQPGENRGMVLTPSRWISG